ncbi:YbjN domain-containing protein [Telmatobacter sp. DSM 110680]|uniref:YbjN domain-containing protein n=1 Tax=Telmatobacter sp. DSM 110680 TaxID=3036704 RepID=A0AAU7DJV6_9BACT
MERTNASEEFAVELLKRIQELLLTKDVTSEIDKDGDLIFIAMCAPVIARIVVSATKSALIVRAYIPLVVPAHRRQTMFECLGRANWQLRFARFEMDPEDGELRCRADMPIHDAVPSERQLVSIIYSVWNVTEGYAPALVEVMMGQVEPAVAIARVEQKQSDPVRIAQETDLSVN